MRVLYITNISLNERTGSRTHIIEFAENFQQIGNKLLMIFPTYLRNQKREFNFKTKQIYFHRKNIMTDMLYALISPILLIYYKFNFKADIIYCRGVSRAALVIPICRLLNFKTVLEINGVTKDELRLENCNQFILFVVLLIYKLHCHLSDLIIAVSEGVKKRIMLDYHIRNDKIFVVNNAANVQVFKPLDKSNCRRLLNLNNDFYIGFVGSFGTWHGIDNIFSAASHLKKFKYDEIKFFLIGNCDSEEKKRLTNLMTKLGIEKCLIFAGEIEYSKIPIYINSFDIGLAQLTNYSSIGAGSPLKVFEYLACGIPVIVSENLGEIAQIIRVNNCGYIFKQDDINDLTNIIIDAYHKKENLSRLGRNSRALAISKFSWQKNAETIQTILNELIK